eukprot:TRINITY_DN21920_c0_g1_i1.p1 TRINITY_DN21920_c0_g1~~TRINITY_DN21920_c0_g1_i1.p1  ORF type:complete len:382 (+),score=105.06 TRINITY_DN21920_c0_g1_i1:71-1147(+)
MTGSGESPPRGALASPALGPPQCMPTPPLSQQRRAPPPPPQYYAVPPLDALLAGAPPPESGAPRWDEAEVTIEVHCPELADCDSGCPGSLCTGDRNRLYDAISADVGCVVPLFPDQVRVLSAARGASGLSLVCRVGVATDDADRGAAAAIAAGLERIAARGAVRFRRTGAALRAIGLPRCGRRRMPSPSPAEGWAAEGIRRAEQLRSPPRSASPESAPPAAPPPQPPPSGAAMVAAALSPSSRPADTAEYAAALYQPLYQPQGPPQGAGPQRVPLSGGGEMEQHDSQVIFEGIQGCVLMRDDDACGEERRFLKHELLRKMADCGSDCSGLRREEQPTGSPSRLWSGVDFAATQPQGNS